MSKIKDLRPSDEGLTNLPPLPEGDVAHRRHTGPTQYVYELSYSAQQMREYAQAALDAAWAPIETAPRDGSEILVLCNIADTWVAHIARWCDEEDFDAGWWSYTTNSVSQEPLDGCGAPTLWRPLLLPPEDR